MVYEHLAIIGCRWALVFILSMVHLSLAGIVFSESENIISISKEFVQLMSTGRYSDVVKNFDDVMKSTMSPEKLEYVWKSITAQVGEFKEQTTYRTEKVGAYTIVYVTCRFERSALDIKLVFNNSSQISGFWVVPVEVDVPYEVPEYVNRMLFEEIEIAIGKEFALPGSLTIPKGQGKFPAVVLIHGMGPNDRDQTTGPNKIFRDIAWGLASRGIAVIRYEKRTKQYPEKLISMRNKLTVNDEYIQDAIFAISYLRSRSQIDSEKIFLLGYDMGGTLIPRIAMADREIAGFIIASAPARPLEDVLFQQVSYVLSLDGKISEDDESKLKELREQVASIKDPKLAENAKATDTFLGIPLNYWLDLRSYDPISTAKKIDKPILVIQGERDFSSTVEDFNMWKEALSDKKDAEFKLYPNLNHLLIEGQGVVTPEEYQKPGHVSKSVIDEISEWIKRH